MRKNHLSLIEATTGAEDFLNLLHKRKIPMGIVSNKRHEFLVKEIAHMKWDHMLGNAVGSGQTALDKPHAEPILYAFGKSSVTPHHTTVWYVGDTATDMLAAKNAGVAAILVTDNLQRRQLEEEHRPLLSFENFASLVGHFKKSA
jgi:phosphoglycolate phosphatase